MADRYPLVVDNLTNTVKEIPSGDNLNLQGSGIVNAGSVNAVSLAATSHVANLADRIGDHDMTPIVGITTIYVATSGSDITGTGTQSAPFATPHRAMEHLRVKPIISSSFGDTPTVIVNVGVGTYNFGLKVTSQGTNYRQTTNLSVTGGSGSGAKVGIITAPGTVGLVTSIFLIDGGVGYVAGESLGVSTSAGSGLAFVPLSVSSTGEILGPIRVDHKAGLTIEIRGQVAAAPRPGMKGNHYYNQAGVGIGSDPALTGASAPWSTAGYNGYDSTSPVGAYPNPMPVGGRGRSFESKQYNLSIIEGYYQSRLYFYGCDALKSHGPGARVNRLALIAPDGIGGSTGLSPGQCVDNTNPLNEKIYHATFGFTNFTVPSTASQSIGYKFHKYVSNGYIGGSGTFGPNAAIFNFDYGMWWWSSGADVQESAFINCGSGIHAQSSAAINADGAIILNTGGEGVLAHRGGDIEFLRGISNNNATMGISLLTGSNVVTGSALNLGVNDTQYTIVANNGTHGVNARRGGVYDTSEKTVIHSNAGVQVVCSLQSQAGVGNTANVQQGSGSATQFSPQFALLGADGSYIYG